MDLKNQSKRITPNNVPQSAQADPKIYAITKELEEELLKVRELRKGLEAQQAEFEKNAKEFRIANPITPAQQMNVVSKQLSKANATKERLSQQPKIEIFIPGEPKETPGSTLPVTIDGYRVNVPKNVYVKVPEQIADIIKEHLNQSVAALRSPLSLDNASEEKQNLLNL